jgi:hypothetical protein
MKIIIAFNHLINFAIVALQRIEAGKGTNSQLHHDLQVAGRAVSMKNTAELQNLLDCFCPMIHNRHWDMFVESIFLAKPCSTDLEARDLNFFTGKPTPVNPILKNGLFHTPQTFEDLRDYTLRHSEGERAAAITCSEMAINLCHKLVEEEIERTS